MNIKEKKKILFVIDTLQLGGAEQSLLANTIRFQQTESVICHLYQGDTLKKAFLDNGKSVHSFNIKSKYGFREAYNKLSRLVGEEKPDLIVAYLTRSEIVARMVARSHHIPVIGTFVNDLYTPSYNQHLSWKAKQVVKFFKFINRITSKICVGFVANSEAIKNANARHLGIPLSKITVINRGRESIKFRRRQDQHSQNSSTIKFVNVSRLFRVKGHTQLILGFKKFLEFHSDAVLHIVGDGPLREELNQLIIENKLEGKVVLLGSRNDVPTLLADYDCFVFPSIMEGFAGSLVEAIFAKLPILATNIDQNKEIVNHLKTGYLFNTESAEEIFKAMLWYKDNTAVAREYADNALDYALENFELSKIVMQFENYLHNKIEHRN